ncbi:type VII secretion target [Nocardia vaccinii]|uniref:type VII secretion target n=1 Tax=Nocardia vaccinii TaxID=1822 RepID=UPI00083471AB|nr:type VII secretion target [Nocardia vaccinii]
MADKLQVDPKVLQQAADGINGVIKELQTIGMSEEAMAGRGFDSLKLSGLTIGTDGLKTAFDSFCDKWEWGVRALMQDANVIAQSLGLAAGSYHMEDEYFSGVLKIAAVDLAGDPNISDDKARNMSWSQIGNQELSDYTTSGYNLQSFETAGHNAMTNWGQAFQQMGPSGTINSAEHDLTGK